MPAGERLVQHQPGRVQVRARRDLAAGGLLGRHVVDRAHDDSRRGPCRVGRRGRRLGDPEIRQHGAPVRDEHVARLYVAMHHPFLVRRAQGVQQVAAELADVLERQRAVQQPGGEGVAREVIHLVVRHAVGFGGGVNGNDVRMAERGEDLRFLTEPLRRQRRVQLGANDLDRHQPVELSVAGEEYGTHAAARQLALDVVAPRREGGPHALQPGGHDGR